MKQQVSPTAAAVIVVVVLVVLGFVGYRFFMAPRSTAQTPQTDKAYQEMMMKSGAMMSGGAMTPQAGGPMGSPGMPGAPMGGGPMGSPGMPGAPMGGGAPAPAAPTGP